MICPLSRSEARATLLRIVEVAPLIATAVFKLIYREHEYLDIVTRIIQIGALPAPVAALARRLKVNFLGLRLPGFQGIDILFYGGVFLVPL